MDDQYYGPVCDLWYANRLCLHDSCWQVMSSPVSPPAHAGVWAARVRAEELSELLRRAFEPGKASTGDEVERRFREVLARARQDGLL